MRASHQLDYKSDLPIVTGGVHQMTTPPPPKSRVNECYAI